MRAEIRWFEWDDLELVDPSSDPVNVVFAAGPVGDDSADNFQLYLCTPGALARLIERDTAVVGRHFLFVDAVDPAVVEAFLRDRVNRLDAQSWEELAAKLGRLAYWEYEDYVPHPSDK